MIRPNVLLIMTDQQRGDSLGIYDHPVLLTPNIDSIGGRGTIFAKAYSTCPVCIPARRSLLTGLHPSTHGMVGHQGGVSVWDSRKSLVNELRDAGYQTYLAGRDMHQHPPRKRYGYEYMSINLPDHLSEGIMHRGWTAKPWSSNEETHTTNWTVTEALKFLGERDPSCPFFLTVSFLAPHPPLIPPPFYMERYLRQQLPEPAIGNWAEPPIEERGSPIYSHNVQIKGEALSSARAGYFAMINHIDDQIMRLFDKHNGGIDLNDTVIIYTSDHGEMLGDHYLWQKSLPYESSARVPLLISVPDSYGGKKGNICTQPVCLEDILPTVLDIAGVKISNFVDGRSLLPFLRGQQQEWRSYIHIEHSTFPFAGDFDSSRVKDGQLVAHHALTDGKWKYIWF